MFSKLIGKQPKAAATLLLRPYAQLPSDPSTCHVYVLPTLKQRLVFHARLPIPSNAAERAAIVAGVVFRRWRFELWDVVAEAYQKIASGKWAQAANRLGTRNAAAEYFFRGVPLKTTRMEFIYPSSIPLRHVKTQLNEYLLSRSKHKRSLFISSVLVFPPALFLSKFMLPVVFNIFFSYLAFRIASAWRAVTIGGRVQTLVDNGRVVFTSSDAFHDRIIQECRLVSERESWKWNGKVTGDLHDGVLEGLEQETKMYEWGRSYRRVRMMSFVHDTDKREEVNDRDARSQ